MPSLTRFNIIIYCLIICHMSLSFTYICLIEKDVWYISIYQCTGLLKSCSCITIAQLMKCQKNIGEMVECGFCARSRVAFCLPSFERWRWTEVSTTDATEKLFNKIVNLYWSYHFYTDGEFESLEVTPLSNPPELPDVMKPDSSSTHAQETAAA